MLEHEGLYGDILGPLIDGGAPHSAIGRTELYVLRSAIRSPHLKSFDSIPPKLSGYICLQYRSAEHNSNKLPMFGQNAGMTIIIILQFDTF